MSKMVLFGSFAMGLTITIKHSSSGREHTGRIQGIALESGYSTGDAPHHFLVNVLTNHGVYVEGVYVRTVD